MRAAAPILRLAVAALRAARVKVKDFCKSEHQKQRLCPRPAGALEPKIETESSERSLYLMLAAFLEALHRISPELFRAEPAHPSVVAAALLLKTLRRSLPEDPLPSSACTIIQVVQAAVA